MLKKLIVKSYRESWESWESQNSARRYNPASVVKFTMLGVKRRHVLPVGESDDWDLYYETNDTTRRVYCVSINRSHWYCGVQAYDALDQECLEELSVFLDNEERIVESLGKRGLELGDRTIARRLIALLDEVTA